MKSAIWPIIQNLIGMYINKVFESQDLGRKSFGALRRRIPRLYLFFFEIILEKALSPTILKRQVKEHTYFQKIKS